MDGQSKVQLILELKDRLKTGLTKAKENLNSHVRDMKLRLSSLKTSHIETFKAMADEVPGFSRAMSLLGNPYALAIAGAVALGVAGFKAAQWSNQFQTKMAEVNVTAGLSHKELNKLSDKLVDIGTRNVAPLEQVPDAFNRIISAGLDVNTSLKVLEPTLRAAKAGFTDMETVAAAGVGVMNASGENINRVYDILFQTLNVGNAKFQDIAHYLPKIVPLAKTAGFALDETAAAWAFLTAQGFGAEQATTGITNMVKALSTGSTVKGLKSVGVNIYTDKGKMKPLVDIIDELSKKMSKLTDKQRTKFLEKAGITDTEAKGSIMAMVQNVEKLHKITDSVVHSQGALNKAYNDALTPLDNWMIMMNIFKGRVVKPVGDALLSAFSKVGFWVLDKGKLVVDWFKDLYNKSQIVRDIISGIGLAINWAFTKATMPIRFLSGLISDMVKAKDGLNFNNIGKNIEFFYMRIRPYFIALKEIIGQVANVLDQFFIKRDYKAAWSSVKNFNMPNIKAIEDAQWKDYYAHLRKTGKGKKGEENPFSPTKDLITDDDKKKDNLDLDKSSIEKITGSAKQIRNITINIKSFVEGGINTQNTKLQQMDEKQIEAYIKDMFMRVIANVETSYQ